MTDETTGAGSGVSESLDNKPAAAVKKSVVTRVLGKIVVDNAEVAGVPRDNNTRWIFDVQGGDGEDISVSLIKHFGRDKTVRFGISPSITLTPMSAETYDARPFVRVSHDKITISSSRCEKAFLVRVIVDVLGSDAR